MIVWLFLCIQYRLNYNRLRNSICWYSASMKTHAALRTLLISKSSRLKQIESPSPINSGIVVVGDSIVQAGNWSLLLETDTRNLGVSDFTTYDLLRHLNRLLRGTPDTVIVAVGINDLIRNKQSGKSLRDIVKSW
jgi:hypothetical protein